MSLEEKKWYEKPILYFVPMILVLIFFICMTVYSETQKYNDKVNERIDRVYEKMIEIIKEKN